MIGDPHVNKPETDKSDYTQFRKAGFMTIKAASGNIDIKARFSMMNTLLCAADGERRLFVALDDHGFPLCPKMIESLKSYLWEQVGKKFAGDLSHYTDNVGYGLHPFEKLKGESAITVIRPSQQRRKPSPWYMEEH